MYGYVLQKFILDNFNQKKLRTAALNKNTFSTSNN